MRPPLVFGAACSLLAAAAWAASPQFRDLRPKGGQRGTEVELTLIGERLEHPQEILFYEPGIQVLSLAAPKARLRIAADCALGEHALRLRTASGVSDLRTFWVGPFPTVTEQKPNNDFATPQQIPLNVTVTGVVRNEDVAYYLVAVKKGQRLSAEIEAMRLGVTLFDPFVAILDAKRFELDASDDTALLRQDSIASIVAPADGNYVIQVRETSYGGNDECVYRLHVGTFPRPRAVYPPGGQTGEELKLRFLGDVAGEFSRTVKLPGQPQVFPVFADQDGVTAPSPNPMRVSPFPNVLETEPNNDRTTATTTDRLPPFALNGIIGEPGDVDWFTFPAKKGHVLDLRVFARQLGSPLDSVIALYDAAGRHLAENDDAIGLDSRLSFTVPADGNYSLLIRDKLGQGGATYTYRIEVTPVQPVVTASVPVFNKDTQERQTVVVPRGNRYATLLTTQGDGVDGACAIQWDKLPPGLTAHIPPTDAGKQIPVVFEAAADAPPGGLLVDVTAQTRAATGHFQQVVNLVRAPPNDTVYHSVTVDRLAVAVAEEAPFAIELVPPQAPLVQAGALDVKVVATRKPGFDEPIRLRMLFNPPGVSSAAEITLPKGQDTAFYSLNASPGATPRTWQIAVLADAKVGGGDLWVSSRFAGLEIAPPFIAGTLEELVTVERGQTAEIICKLDQRRPFTGKAKIRLLGLPPHITTAEREITKSDSEVTFPLRTDAQAPIGKHKSLFCTVELQQNGETIRHALGNVATLRIDPPPQRQPDAPKPAAAAPPPPPAKPDHRLSRLDQLRLDQEHRASASAP